MQLWEDLKKKKFASVYVLVGEEKYLIDHTKQLIISTALLEDEVDFNLTTFDLGETPIEQAIGEMETVPFLGERRVVILKNAFFLTGAELKREKVVHDLERLHAYLENPPSFTIAVFIVDYPKLDERKKITKAFKKKSVIFSASQLSEYEMHNWLIGECKKRNITMDKDAISALIYLTGKNMQRAAIELDKLEMHGGTSLNITEELVMSMVTKTLDQNVFHLVELIVLGKRYEACKFFHELLMQKEEPIRIIGAIARQYRILLLVKFHNKKGRTVAEMASLLKINPYPVKLALKMTKKFSEKYLLQKLCELAELDLKMKTGQGDKELLLDLFILQEDSVKEGGGI